MANDTVHAGYLPLLDSAILVVAAQLGFAARHGIDLVIHRERSWAALRDRMSVGHFDCAQMPAPMPIATSLSHGPLPATIFAPMVLNTGGNAVTVGMEIAAALKDEAPPDAGPAAMGAALSFAIARLNERNKRAARFAVVHRFSCHNYDLRYWLAASGIRPDEDVEITVVPPSLMPDALASGQIDGFSAGEPWNTIAVRRRIGEIVAVKAEIAPRSPEKVLGVSKVFLKRRRDVLERLILSLLETGEWCDRTENHSQVSELMGEERHVAVDAAHLLPGMTGELETGRHSGRRVPDFLAFSGTDLNQPDPRYAAWLHRQMLRWGHSRSSSEADAIVAGVLRPDVFISAARPFHRVTEDNPGTSISKLSGFRLFDDARL